MTLNRYLQNITSNSKKKIEKLFKFHLVVGMDPSKRAILKSYSILKFRKW